MKRMRWFGFITPLEFTHLSHSTKSLILGASKLYMYLLFGTSKYLPEYIFSYGRQLINNKVLTRDNLAKWRKVKDPSCLLCLEQESVHHLFFECVVAKQCWKVISDAVGTIVGIDLAVIGQFWLSEKRHGILNIVTSAVFWSIWKLRNEILFQNAGWRTTR